MSVGTHVGGSMREQFYLKLFYFQAQFKWQQMTQRGVIRTHVIVIRTHVIVIRTHVLVPLSSTEWFTPTVKILAVASMFNPSVSLISDVRPNKTSQKLKNTNVKTTLTFTLRTVFLSTHSGTNKISSEMLKLIHSICVARAKYPQNLPQFSQCKDIRHNDFITTDLLNNRPTKLHVTTA